MKGIILTLSLLCFGLTYGYSLFRNEIPNGKNTTHPCPGKGIWSAVGHMKGEYTPQKNVFGQDFRRERKWTVELCSKDSDGDGLTNGQELGDPLCKWTSEDIYAPDQYLGHPGFCEPDRSKCESGMTHPECPNPHAARRGRIPAKTLPAGANYHPQTFLSKNLDQGAGMARDVSRFGMGQSSFVRDQGMPQGRRSWIPSSSGRVSMSSSGFDSSFGGRSRRPSARLDTSGSQSFGPPPRQSFTSFDTRSLGAPSLSQDFGIPSGRSMGPQLSGMGRSSGTGFMTGRNEFSMMQAPGTASPGMDRFRSSLDQRSIQGMGSPASGPSFQSLMSQTDIERSVQARMDRERSRLGGGRGMRTSSGFSGTGSSGMSSGGMASMGGSAMSPMGPSSMGSIGPGGMGPMSPGGMGPMSPGGMGPMGPGSMGSTRPGSMGPMGPGSMAAMSPSDMGSQFSGGMEGYPPFIPRGSIGFGGPLFSSEGAPVAGASFSGGMSMPGGPGMSRGSSGTMMRPTFSRF